MHGFGSVSVFCFLFFNYTTGGCLASLPFVIFCSFLFDPPIPLPLLSPLFPYLLVVSPTHVDDVFFSPIVSRFPACCSGLRSWGRMSDVRQCYDDKHLGLLFLVDEVSIMWCHSCLGVGFFFPPLAVIYNCSLIAPACGGMCGSVMKQWPHILHGASLA